MISLDKARMAEDVLLNQQSMGKTKDEAVATAAGQLGVKIETVHRYLRMLKEYGQHNVEVVQPRFVRSDLGSNFNGLAMRVMAIGDSHSTPDLPSDRFYHLGCHARKTKPDVILHIGDFASFDSLSTYDANDTMKGQLKPTYQEDLEALDRDMEAFNAGKGSWEPKLRHCTLGNHENRVYRQANARPELYGLLLQAMLDKFEKYGWSVSEYGKVFYLQGVGFTHVPFNEMGQPYGGKTAEQRAANDSVHDLVFGHSHRYRVIHNAKIGGQSVTVLNLGCTMPQGYVADYAKHSATGWTYGVVDLELKDGKIADHQRTSMDKLEELYG